MRKMPFRFARRVRNLEIKTSYYCPTKKKTTATAGYLGSGGGDSHGGRRDSYSSSSSLSSSSYHHHHHQQICPSCVLPIVVAFIFGFTVIQLIVIHRTIVAYKSRSLAFEEVYGPSHNDTKSQGDLLAFSKKFDSALLPMISVLNSSGSTTGGNAASKVVYEWKPTGQVYPYRIPPRHNINHIWTKVKCPEVPKSIHGNISINIKSDVSLESLARNNPQVKPGGKWSPEDCSSRFHVALIIPYRYRWNHLKLLLSVLHPMLKRQKMSYQIFVAEQFGNYTFNKGLLMNAAFLMAVNNASTVFDCVIFHDVDLLPEMDTNIYGCAKSPTHLSVSIDAYAYRLPYSKLVGGVFAISVDHFLQVNGYSNLYWGWGAEDDDMYKRLIANQLPLNRPHPDLAKYKMLQHGRRVPNQFINPLIRTARLRYPQDGLTTCHFRLVSLTSQALFTHFLVDVGQPSWSVMEPHIPLESMIPPSPSTAPLISHIHRSSSSSTSTTSVKHAHSQHHHHHLVAGGTKTSNIIPRKKNDLHLLTGIARDYSASSSDNHLHHSNKNYKNGVMPPSLPARQARSLSNLLSSTPHLSPSSVAAASVSRASKEQNQLGRSGEIWRSTELYVNKVTHSQRSGRFASYQAGILSTHKNDVALDPDVPVVQDDDEEDDDMEGDSDDGGAF